MLTDLCRNVSIINLLLTKKCNYSCSYCHQLHKDDVRLAVSPPERIHEIVEKLATINDIPKNVRFFGGETLLRFPDIKAYFEAYQPNYPALGFSVYSNGSLLTPDMGEFLAKNGVDLTLSIDGYTEDGQLEKDYKRLETVFPAIYRIYATHGRMISVSVTIDIAKVQAAKNLMVLFTRRFPRTKLFISPVFHSKGDGNTPWSMDAIDDLLGFVETINQQRATPILQGLNVISSPQKCISVDWTLAVDLSGDLSSCFFTITDKLTFPEYVYGNLLDDRFDAPQYAAILERKRQMFDNPYCAACRFKETCISCSTCGMLFNENRWFENGECKPLVHFLSGMHHMTRDEPL
jgi:radical SAM protein with 4Fe4S-binding SPASM domain